MADPISRPEFRQAFEFVSPSEGPSYLWSTEDNLTREMCQN